MSIPSEYQGKYFFHFTHIENLESIVENGILATNIKIERNIKHKNVASESIQHRRSEMNVTCHPYGKVHDYVPFYFTSTNPMLLSLTNNKNIDQPFIIFFAIPIDRLNESSVVFTDASANTVKPPNFFNDPVNLDRLDWNSIDSKKWGCANDDDKHKRMAEVLVHSQVSLDWIDTIIVWNKVFKKETLNIFKEKGVSAPQVTHQPFHGKFFYFCKFFFTNRSRETLVTGPYFLEHKFKKAVEEIINIRNTGSNDTHIFKNIKDALHKIDEDFSIIPELEGILNLKTKNPIHKKNVSDHTLQVVKNLNSNEYYEELSDKDKDIIKLSAYLHDIGKGPKSKWSDGIQHVYLDHPSDSLASLTRILTEDFKELSEYEVRKICLLVAYHDIMGDIIANNRNKEEVINIVIDEIELNMLAAISLADTSAINFRWGSQLNDKIPFLITEVKGLIEND